MILGACNPPFAHQSLQTDLDVGLLLSCNVILYETDDRKTFVAAVSTAMLWLVILITALTLILVLFLACLPG